MTYKTFLAFSRKDMEDKLDAFLRDNPEFTNKPLIMAVNGSSRYEYRGISVREWWNEGNVRYDSCVEVPSYG